VTRTNIIVLVLGVALAIAAGISVYLAVQLAGQTAAAPTEVAMVVSAASDIPAGTTFGASNTATLVRTARVPASQLDQQAVTSPLSLLGRATLAPVRAGEILVEQHLSASTGAAAESLAARLEPGLVAVALPANDATTVAGAVRAMDRVDLIASVPMRHSDGAQRVVTHAIVRDARVLAVGGQAASGQGGRPSTPTTLTLALSPQDALVVEHLVQANVRVVLALRRPEDPPALDTTPVSMEDIVRRLSGNGPQPASAAAPGPSAPAATSPTTTAAPAPMPRSSP
jgi:Flp pilus assembly protein CpaB